MGRGIAASRRRRRFTDQTVRRRVPQRIRPRPGAGRTRLIRVMQGAFTWEGWTKLGALATAVAAVGALIFTSASLRVANEQQEQVTKAQMAQQFTTASEQLGRESEHVRMGGLYLLEQLARDSERYHGVVFEVIGAFVRSKAELGTECSPPRDSLAEPELSVEVQAAITIIGRRGIPAAGDEVDLAETCLAGADFRNAELARAILNGADLKAAKLSGVNLRGAQLYNADLSGAYINVDGGPISGYSYSYEYSDGRATVEVARQSRSADLTDADLGGAKLNGAMLTEAALRGANLARAQLDGVTVVNVDFSRADLTDSTLRDANAAGSRWVGAVMDGADLRGANMIGADLTNASLRWADLRGTDLSWTTLTDVDFGANTQSCARWFGDVDEPREECRSDAAIYDATTVWPEGFAPSWASPPPRQPVG